MGEQSYYAMSRMPITRAVLLVIPLLASARGIEEQRSRIQRLERSVLAPCCYNEPVAVHQSEIAVQMKLEIARWVEQGRTDDDILQTYATQYGIRVLVNPSSNPSDWTLVVPWAVLFAGTMWGVWKLSRWRAVRPEAGAATPQGMVLQDLPDFDEE